MLPGQPKPSKVRRESLGGGCVRRGHAKPLPCGLNHVGELCLLPLPPAEIGNAYAVLSNPDKRRQYDLTGAEEAAGAAQAHGGFHFHRGFEADITPEDLFNMFFGGGFPSCMHGHRASGPRRERAPSCNYHTFAYSFSPKCLSLNTTK